MMHDTSGTPTHQNCNHCLARDLAFKLVFAQSFCYYNFDEWKKVVLFLGFVIRVVALS